MLESLKEHQRQNALRRKAFLVRQTNLSKKGVEARQQKAHDNPRVTHGKPKGNPTVAQAKAKARVKEEAKVIDSSFTVGDEESRADAAPPSPLTVADAKKELMVLAPPVNSHNYSKDNIQYYNETKDDDWASADAAIEHTLVVVDEPDNNTTRITLAKLCAKIGLSLFHRAVFRFDTEIFNAEHGGDGDGKCPFRSKGKTLIARLKKLSAAVDALSENTLDAVDAAEGGEEG